MAVKLLVPKWGFAAGTIVRDLPMDTEKDLARLGLAGWHLDGGIEATRPTLPSGDITQLERQMLLDVDAALAAIGIDILPALKDGDS